MWVQIEFTKVRRLFLGRQQAVGQNARKEKSVRRELRQEAHVSADELHTLVVIASSGL
jgi:hypothetical protein